MDICLRNNIVYTIACYGSLSLILSRCITYAQNYNVPLQIAPLFTNPSFHWQLYDPSVFLHSELSTTSHGLTCAVHSSTSKTRVVSVSFSMSQRMIECSITSIWVVLTTPSSFVVFSHSVGHFTLTMTPSSPIWSSSSLNILCKCTGTARGM